MKKALSLTVFIILSMICKGQEVTFQKNVNLNAAELSQALNKSGDSLLLESNAGQISKVVIFNDDYSNRISVDSSKTKIDLKTLPLGNYVVQAKISNKWIVMSLSKNQNFEFVTSVHNENHLGIDQNQSVTTHHSVEDNDPDYYWVVSESNSNFGSSKSMRLEYKARVSKLITKNKHEQNSAIAKENTLMVYAVYDKSNFMNKQSENPEYYKSAEHSTYFDSTPYYSSNDNLEHGSTP